MNADKREYLYRFHRFQKSREVHFAPKIFKAIRSQYDLLLSFLESGHTEQDALYRINSAPIIKVLREIYLDAGIQYGAKVRADLNKVRKKSFAFTNYETKARLPMGFSEQMRQVILDYFSVDILNQSQGITETTRELIQKIFSDAYEKGEGIDDIISQLKDTELTRIRARLIARTETVTSSNQGALFVAKSTGLELNKEWLSANDNRVRNHHRHLNGQTVGVDDYFRDHGVSLQIPGARVQENGLPVPASFVCNCRCSVLFQPID